MKKTMPLTKIASVILITLSATSCARFEERAQAEGTFDYENATLTNEYKSGNFTRDEQRNAYQIPVLTEQQKQFGMLGIDVDIRPPVQLMAVIEGVSIDPDAIQTKVWFNAFKQDEKMDQKVWDLILKYLSAHKANSVQADRSSLTIETGPIVRFTDHGRNEVREQADYSLSIEEAADGRSASLSVDVKDYQQVNDGIAVKQILEARTKHSIEIRFINDLLAFAYTENESETLQDSNKKPLPIKLGFDDNHQTAWIIDTPFINVWEKLPALLTTMSFEAVQENKNLGYFLVEFVPQDAAYWAENGLNPITLESGEYFAQLGELSNGQTSIIWLDSDKKVLSDQEVTDLYLSITEKLRSVTLSKDVQKKSL
ncbi:outer membrane protein assembly factor BamC [Psychromonas algicola]|uniref:outer membrane protein assembly factor BamC n=1 Tax=Psychromonas algicola TaxID=2555642 RepID=UPI0010674E94|nr:outer membrane protein assembly factor BamC [Psychromonas sp. RZ5]TEW52910.1 outer membrane protein assembly factor BamC [Psychromonas sp. RZ5]